MECGTSSNVTTISVTRSCRRLPVHSPRLVVRTHCFGLYIAIENRSQRTQHFQLLVAHGIRIAGRRRLHREDADELQQVTLYHVAQRARLIVELAAPFDAQLLGDRNLHMAYAATSPKRLE